MTFALLCVAVFCVLVAVWGCCRMAAIGDRELEKARRNLKGPESRDRIGL